MDDTDKPILEVIKDNLFTIIHGLEHCYRIKNIGTYKSGLRALDDYNGRYRKLTGRYYINELEMLRYKDMLKDLEQ